MILTLISVFLFLSYTALISFYKYSWDHLPYYKLPEEGGALPKLSVVIAARNEEKNIQALCSALKEQTYPTNFFEVILVDDHSTDHTLELSSSTNLSNLVVISMKHDSPSSKKKAIDRGIEASMGELIITTDADCLPTPTWLQTMAKFYVQKGGVFIAAPVAYNYQNKLLHIFQAVDFMTLQGITAASVAANFHTMCNGANLAYQKKAFVDVNGFEGIDRVASGDDMLLMYKIWKKHPDQVMYLKSRDAIVYTAPIDSWTGFWNQRIRWASKTTHYEDKRVLGTLLLVYAFNLLFPVLFIAAFWNQFYWLLIIIYLVGKTLVELPFVYDVARFYNQQYLMRYFFFLQPLHILYTVSIGLFSQLGKYEWKGRRTK